MRVRAYRRPSSSFIHAGSPGFPRLSILAALVIASSACATLPDGPATSGGPVTSANQAAPAAPTAAPGSPPQAQAPGTAPAAAAPGAAPQPQAAPPAPGAPPPFQTVIRDAKKTEGLLPIWQKDEKVWIELRPEDFGKPFFLSPKLSTGLGENGFFGGLMASTWGRVARPQIVEFRRVHNVVQMIARNSDYFAAPGTPEARGIDISYSPSLLGSVPVASQAHPERKTVLIEANGIFLSDMMALGMALNRTYRQPYSLDARNSAITKVRNTADLLVFDVSSHFVAPNLQFPAPGATPPGAPLPTLPSTVPDARSLFLGVHYSLMPLPEKPMQPRLADPRVGYFTTTRNDFTNDIARTPRVRYVNRWRLEKKDPTAAISEPVRPITFWLDRNIPVQFRAVVTEGVLEWNKAFERIGFKDAIVVKQQADDAEFDTLDANVASVRWMTSASPMFGAIGPSHVDPRTGEILDADIGFESLITRNVRSLRSQILAGKPPLDVPMYAQLAAQLAQSAGQSAQSNPAAAANPFGFASNGLIAQSITGPQAGLGFGSHDPRHCNYADFAAEQLGYALDLLTARGELDPASPEAQRFVLDYVKDIMMHEVGHTLGLRHNFRASRIYTDAQLSDPEFTRANGIGGSVMEYSPLNLSRPGERGGTPSMLTLGPYDYWAIEYAYKPMPPGTTAEQEKAELAKIAGRNAEPFLAYATDEDNILGLDPDSQVFDLGNDIFAFTQKRIDIAQDLLRRQERRELKPTEDYSVLRRSLSYAMRDVMRSAAVLARYVGGLSTLRDFPGSGRDPLVPTPAKAQREALDLLAGRLLSADSFKVNPTLQRRLAPDFTERTEVLFSGDMPVATDFNLENMVLFMQRALLAQLMSEPVTQRILDSQGKVSEGGDRFRLSELYSRLGKEVWSELRGSGDIPALRRELQRDHAHRLSALLLRPANLGRADARSLLRLQANELLAEISKAERSNRSLSLESRAHLADVSTTLKQALEAKINRPGL